MLGKKKMMTVLYYTCNRELPKFEKNVMDLIRNNSAGLPIVSVSQKPIDFGKNICVGDVGVSPHNTWRQIQIGLKEVDTEFVCLTESDTLYPPDYFRFVPDSPDKFYLAYPVYILYALRGKSKYFCKKPSFSTSAIVINTAFLARRVDNILDSKVTWTGYDTKENVTNLPELYYKVDCETFPIEVPIISFKTSQGMHMTGPIIKTSKTKLLPYWGNCRELIQKYMYE